MARRSFLDRAREFISGTSRRVFDFVESALGITSAETERERLRGELENAEAEAQRAAELDRAQEAIQKEIDALREELGPDAIPHFPPEQFEDGELEERIEESEFEVVEAPFSTFDPTELRRILATFDDAEKYASDIPLNDRLHVKIIRDPNLSLYRVHVDYEIVVSE